MKYILLNEHTLAILVHIRAYTLITLLGFDLWDNNTGTMDILMEEECDVAW